MKYSSFLLIFLTMISLDLSVATTVTVATGDFPPYLSHAYKDDGYISRIITEAFKLEGLDVTYTYFPWTRAYSMVQSGDADITPFWLKTPEREKLFYLTDPIETLKYSIFYLKKNKFTWSTITDLAHFRIGVTKDYSYGKDFDDARKANLLQIDEVSTDESNLRKLLAGHIDIFLSDKMMALDLLKTRFTAEERDEIAVSSHNLVEEQAYLLVSRKIPNGQDLVRKFNSGLKKLKESGEFEKILNANY